MFLRDPTETAGTQPAGHAAASQAVVLPAARAMPIPLLAPRSRSTSNPPNQQQLAQQPVVTLNQSPQKSQQQPAAQQTGLVLDRQWVPRQQLPLPQLAPRPTTATQSNQQPRSPAQQANATASQARPTVASSAQAPAAANSAAMAGPPEYPKILESLRGMAGSMYQSTAAVNSVVSNPAHTAFAVNLEALKVFSGCDSTPYKGVLKRKSDNKFLSTLLVPPAPASDQKEGVWVVLKACDTSDEAITLYDCVAIGHYGKKANTNRPAASYTVSQLVRNMILARAQSSFNNTHVHLLFVVNSVIAAKAAGVKCEPQAERAAEDMIREHIHQMLLPNDLPVRQPGGGVAAAPAQPAASQAAAPSGGAVRSSTPTVPPVAHPVLAAFKGRPPAAGTPAAAAQQHSATPPPGAVKPEGSPSNGQPVPNPGNLLTAAARAALQLGPKPGSPAPGAGGSPFAKLQAAQQQQLQQQQQGNLMARTMLMANRSGTAPGSAGNTSAQASLPVGNPHNKPGVTGPNARPPTPTNAGADALVKVEGQPRPASAGPAPIAAQQKAAHAPINVQQQMLSLVNAVASGKVPPNAAGLQQLLANMQQQVNQQQQQAQRAAAGPGAAPQQPNGVTLVTSGPQKGKWEVHTRYYNSKGDLSMQVLGHFSTRDEAVTVHDCAALAVPNSVRYQPASKYSMKQVLTLVFSMCHKPGYDLEGIVRDAQLNAFKYGLKPLLEEVGQQQAAGTSSKDGKATPPPPAAPAKPAPPRPVTATPALIPAGLSMPSVSTALTQTSGQLVKLLVQVVKDTSGEERVRAHILVLPNLNATRAAVAAQAPGANNQLGAIRTTLGGRTPVPPRFKIKYIPALRQDLGGVQGGMAAGIIQAQRFVGVHAEQEPGGTIIKFSVQLQYTPGTIFSLRSFNSAQDAARIHDLLAVGVFGKSAVAHLNALPHNYSYHEVLQAVQVLAKQYDAVRMLHLPHVLECAAEAGVNCKGAVLDGVVGQNAAPIQKVDGRKRKADADAEGGGGREKIGKVAAGQLAQPTQYTGVWQETAGVNAGKFSAKQCGPTGQPRTPNIYLVVGYFETADAAARARDRAAIALQSAPRLNFPGETHTRAQILAAVNPMIEGSRKSLAKDVLRIIETNITRYERKVTSAPIIPVAVPNKTTTVTVIKVLLQPSERVAVTLQPVLETSMTDADTVTVNLSVYEGVSLQLAVLNTTIPTLTGPGSPISSRVALTRSLASKPLGAGRPSGSPMAKHAVAAAGALLVPGATQTQQRTGHKREARVAREAQEILSRSQRRKPSYVPSQDKDVGSTAAMDVDAVPTPPSSMLVTAGPENSEQDNERGTSAMEAGTASAAESMDVDEQDAERQAVDPELAEATEEDSMLVEKEYWDAQRAAKRARGVLPSALQPNGEFLGVIEEPAPGSNKVMWAGKASLTNKDGRPAYLVVGRYDDPEMAARVRDLGALAVGTASVPRLNFDADEYQLSEVELLLGSLVEEYPQHFTLDMLIPALKSAAKHGVKNDLPQDHAFYIGQKVAVRKRGSGQASGRNTPPPRDNMRSSMPSRQSLVDLTRQDSQAFADLGEDQQAGALSRQGSHIMLPAVAVQRKASIASTVSGSSLGVKRPHSPELVSPEAQALNQPVVPPDYVCVALRVVPHLRVTLVPDPAPCARRPLVRMFVQETSGVQLDLRVGAAPDGWAPPSSYGPHAKRARQLDAPDMDMLLFLADVAMQEGGDDVLMADSEDGMHGGLMHATPHGTAAAGRGPKRGVDGRARATSGATSPEHHAQVAIKVAALPQLLDPFTDYDQQVQTAEAILMKLRRENEAVLRQALQNMELAAGMVPRPRLGGGREAGEGAARGMADRLNAEDGQLVRYGNGAQRGQALRQAGRGGASVIPTARAVRGGRPGSAVANAGTRRAPPPSALNSASLQHRLGAHQQGQAKHAESVTLNASSASSSSSGSSTSDEEEVPSSSSSSSSDDDELVPLAKRARAARGGGQAGRGGRGGGGVGAGRGGAVLALGPVAAGRGTQVGHSPQNTGLRPAGAPVGLNLASRPQQGQQLPPNSSLATQMQQQKLQQLQQLHRAGQKAQTQGVAEAARKAVQPQYSAASGVAGRKPAVGLNLNPAVQQPGQVAAAVPPVSKVQALPSAFRSSVATSVAKMVGLSQSMNAATASGMKLDGELASREGSGASTGVMGGASGGSKRPVASTRDAAYHEQLARHVQNRASTAMPQPQVGASKGPASNPTASQQAQAMAAAGASPRHATSQQDTQGGQQPRMMLVPAGAAWAGAAPMMIPYPGSVVMDANGNYTLPAQFSVHNAGALYTSSPNGKN